MNKEQNAEGYRFFSNKACKYYPCHTVEYSDNFNCMFCYCPLYVLGELCGGNYSYENDYGIKDCSGCMIPHSEQAYDYIIEKSKLIIDMVKK